MNDSEPPQGAPGSPEETPRPDDDASEDASPEEYCEPRSEDSGEAASAPHGWSTEFHLERWKVGDESGFDALHDHFAHLLAFRVRGHRVWPMLESRHQVEDQVQNVWEQVVQDTRRSFISRGPGSFLAYLAALVEHTLIDQARADLTQKRGDGARIEDLDALVEGWSDTEAQPAAVETPTSHARLRDLEERIAKRLLPRELEVWELKQQGYTHAEIAFALRDSESATRGLYLRARRRIIEGLGEEDGGSV